jgi:hypothetical protein
MHYELQNKNKRQPNNPPPPHTNAKPDRHPTRWWVGIERRRKEAAAVSFL